MKFKYENNEEDRNQKGLKDLSFLTKRGSIYFKNFS